MGPNPSFFKFIKNMLRASPKVSYIKHMVSSSISLKNKEVLSNHGRGKIEVKRVKSLENIMEAIVVTLEHGTCSHLVLSLGNLLFFESCQSYESLHSFDPFEEFPGYHHTMIGHISSGQCFQVTCHATQCSSEIPASINHLTVFLTFHPHVGIFSFYLLYHII